MTIVVLTEAQHRYNAPGARCVTRGHVLVTPVIECIARDTDERGFVAYQCSIVKDLREIEVVRDAAVHCEYNTIGCIQVLYQYGCRGIEVSNVQINYLIISFQT